MDREFREEERGLWANADSSDRWVVLARSHWREGRLLEAYRAFQNSFLSSKDPEIQKLTAEMASTQRPYLELLPKFSIISLSSSLPGIADPRGFRRQVEAGMTFFDTVRILCDFPFYLQDVANIPFLENFEFYPLNKSIIHKIEKDLSRQHHMRGEVSDSEASEILTSLKELPCRKSLSIKFNHDLLKLLKANPLDPRRDFLEVNIDHLNFQNLSALKSIRALKSIKTENTELGKEGLQLLCQFRQLEKLRMWSDQDWSSLDFPLDKLNNLVQLDLSYYTLNKHHLSLIGKLTQLKKLQLAGIKSFVPEDFKFLRSLKHLTSLSLRQVTSFDDKAVTFLNGLPKLRELVLNFTQVSASAVRSLQLPSLYFVVGQNFHFIKD